MGIVAGVGEVIDAFFIDFPLAAIVTAALFFLGVVLTLRGRLAGVVIIGILCLLEAVAVPFYPRETTTDWLTQIPFGVLGVIGVVAAGGALVTRRRGTGPSSAA